ncbi:MAG: alpha/beta hydrolase family protein [Gemmatimonadales bacterium]
MRPFEWVLVLAVSAAIVGWLLGKRPPKPAGLLLLAVLVVHVATERPRMPMWPTYLLTALVVIAAARARAPAAGPRSPLGRALRVGVAMAGLLLLTLPWLWPVMRLPAPTGPHPVGSTWLMVVDSARTERFRGHGHPREFPVKVWYPAAADTGRMTPYLNDAREIGLGILPPFLFEQQFLVRTHSTIGAPFATGERWPVLVFSHGYGGFAGQNTVQMEDLASHGYVVFSIVHPGEAGWTPFPAGAGMPMDSAQQAELRQMMADTTLLPRFQAAMKAIEAATTTAERHERLKAFLDLSPEPLRSRSVAEWSADTKGLVDLLEVLGKGAVASPFAGRLDLERIGIFGMSYGGATAGEFCRLDSRCRAGANMDGGQFGGLADDSLTVPFLIMASEENAGAHGPVLDLIRQAPGYLVTVPQTTHLGLTDLTLMGPLLRFTGVTGRLAPDRRETIMSRYLLAFFDTHLRGQPSTLLDGRSEEFPEVSIVRNTP